MLTNPPVPRFESAKLQVMLSTSMGMVSMLDGLLAQAESAPNSHKNYAHARNVARAHANIYCRCIRLLGEEPKDGQGRLKATSCEFHKVSEMSCHSGIQVKMTTDLLDQAESVPGMHEEYRDALGLGRILESLYKDCLGELGEEARCR